jgi:hypothetical protein
VSRKQLLLRVFQQAQESMSLHTLRYR